MSVVKRSVVKRSMLAGAGAVFALVLAGCSTSATDTEGAEASTSPSAAAASPSTPGSPAPDSAAESKAPAAKKPAAGVEVDYAEYSKNKADYANSDVVLFFSAAWCSTCQAAHNAIDSEGVPDGMTIVDVDYDTAQDLRQQYGVTIQHTFVQVDENGKQLTKFSGSVSPGDIQSNLV